MFTIPGLTPLRFLTGRLIAVYHPGYSEPIDEHAETAGPESLLDRHLHRCALSQGIEHTVRILRLIDTQGNRTSLDPFIMGRRRIRAHQRRVANHQRGMHHFVMPFRRHLIRHRRTRIPVKREARGSEALFVEPEGRFAVPVETEVRIYFYLQSVLHDALAVDDAPDLRRVQGMTARATDDSGRKK